MKKIPNDEIIKNVKEVIETYSDNSRKNYILHGKYSAELIRDRFGG